MKKYICPLTEKQEVMHLNSICDPSAGSGQQQNPVPGGQGRPWGAPGRAF